MEAVGEEIEGSTSPESKEVDEQSEMVSRGDSDSLDVNVVGTMNLKIACNRCRNRLR